MIERKDHRLIWETVNQQLSFLPGKATGNRKPLEQPKALLLRAGTGAATVCRRKTNVVLAQSQDFLANKGKSR